MAEIGVQRIDSHGVRIPASRGKALGRLLDMAENAPPYEGVDAVARWLREVLGATDVTLLMADMSGRALVRLTQVTTESPLGAPAPQPLPHGLAEPPAVIPFEGGPAERALRTQTLQLLAPGSEYAGGVPSLRWKVLAPVTERGEAIGLLELLLPAEPDQDTLEDIARTAHALAFVVIANRRHTDLFEWGQRSVAFSLAAEIQRRLLPDAYTCEGGAFTLSGWLGPAADVGGDTFDYSLGRDVLHLSVTDAMGHGVTSALVATLCVGSLRNTRRRGGGLREQAERANAALIDHITGVAEEGFVTGVLGGLDLRSGALTLVNAGHVSPYLWRDGQVTTLELPVDLPFGISGAARYRRTVLSLAPGDRLVFVTDGMLERSASALDLGEEIRLSRDLHPREATRWLADSVANTVGSPLEDDATTLVLDWHVPAHPVRRTTAGADADA